MIENSKAPLLLAPLPLAIAFALNPIQAEANGLIFASLCGQTLTQNVKIVNANETIYGRCDITVSDGYKLTILNSDLTFEEGAHAYDAGLNIDGADSPDSMAMLTIKNSTFDLSEGNMFIDFADGKVTVRDGEINLNGDDGSDSFSIYTRDGDVTFKDNAINLDTTSQWKYIRFGTRNGQIDVKENTIDYGTGNSGFSMYAWDEDGSITFKDNDTAGCSDVRWMSFSVGGGDLEVVRNVLPFIGDDFSVFSDGGDIEVVGNAMAGGGYVGEDFSVRADGADMLVLGNMIPVDEWVRLDSDGGDIYAIDNDFTSGSITPDNTYVDSNGGDCTVYNNDPTLTCSPP